MYKSLNDLFAAIKGDTLVCDERRIYEVGEVSPVTNLQKKADGTWGAPDNSTANKPDITANKPDIINGYFNGKIYGNEKYGYRMYVDNKEVKITPEQKSQIEQWQKSKNNQKAVAAEAAGAAGAKNKVINDMFGFMQAAMEDIAHLANDPERFQKGKAEILEKNFFGNDSVIKTLEEKLSADHPEPEFKEIIERLKKDKDFTNQLNQDFIAEIEKKVDAIKADKEKNAKIQQMRDDITSRVSSYIKEHGEPSLIQNTPGYWNGKVYGKPGNYSIYISGKNGKSRQYFLSDSDLAEFGLS